MKAATFKRLFEGYEILSDQQVAPTKKGIAFAADAISNALMEVGMNRDRSKRVKRTNRKILR